jgi:hypothetical protein
MLCVEHCTAVAQAIRTGRCKCKRNYGKQEHTMCHMMHGDEVQGLVWLLRGKPSADGHGAYAA